MIEAMYIADASTCEMKHLRSATLIAGRGIDGDRYCSGRGTYSVMAEPGRQLTLISAESAEDSLAAAGLKLCLGNLRRNLVVRGLSASQLLDAVGCEVSLGGRCTVFVHRSCVPCSYNERKNQCPGLAEALWETAGVSCEILCGGQLSLGDEVEILTETRDQARTKHGKPAGFFVRPSQRGMPVVRALRDGLRGAHSRLEAQDAAGCARVAAAYASVGLTFWPPAQRSVGHDDAEHNLARGSVGRIIVSRCASLAALLVPVAAVAVAVMYVGGDAAAGHDEL